MMKKPSAFLLLIPLILFGCRKDDPIETNSVINNPVVASQDYFPMTPGSYWVYHWYVVDSTGNATLLNVTDSIYISGDTVIGSSTYYIQEGTWFGGNPFQRFLRDSTGYLVDASGRIHCSSVNYTDTLYTWYPVNMSYMGFTKMNDIGLMVTVPAGTFNTINAEYIVVNLTGTWPCIGVYDIHDNQYAEDVGVVRTTFQLTPDILCRVFEQRLVNYHIN